ncbi:hypothetical protein AAMO2058_000645600 [Amorphochlora amoebiformis]
MLFTFLAVSYLPQGLARPSYFGCSTSRTAGSFVTGSMGASAQTLQASTSGECSLGLSSLSGGYTAGQSYTLTLSSNAPRGLKTQVSSGVFTAGGSPYSGTCHNDNSITSSQTYTWTAPAAGTGTVTFQGICGRSSGIYLASSTVSEAAITTSSPTANPMTSSPTTNPTSSPVAPSQSSSPTKTPTAAPVVTSRPTANPATWNPTANPATWSPSANPVTSWPTANPVTSSPTVQPPTSMSPTASNRACVVSGGLSGVKPGCKFEGSSNNFGVEWAINSTHIFVKASASTTGYVGMGWGKSMPGSFAVLGWCVGSTRNIQEYSISSRSVAGVSAQGWSRLSKISCTEADGKTTIEFLRPLSTPTGTFDLSGSHDIIYASHDTDSLAAHSSSEYGKAKINFESGESEEVEEIDYITSHSAVMWIAFSFLMPLGVAAPIFFRDCFPSVPGCWFKFHMGVQFLAAAFMIVGFVLAFYVTQNDDERFEDPHGQLGLSLIIFASLQMLAGILRPHKEEGSEQSTIRTVWKGFHQIVGAFLVIGGLINCSLGLQANDQAEDIWKSLQWVWTAIVLILGIGGLIYMKGCRESSEPKAHKLAMKSGTNINRKHETPRV